MNGNNASNNIYLTYLHVIRVSANERWTLLSCEAKTKGMFQVNVSKLIEIKIKTLWTVWMRLIKVPMNFDYALHCFASSNDHIENSSEHNRQNYRHRKNVKMRKLQAAYGLRWKMPQTTNFKTTNNSNKNVSWFDDMNMVRCSTEHMQRDIPHLNSWCGHVQPIFLHRVDHNRTHAHKRPKSVCRREVQVMRCYRDKMNRMNCGHHINSFAPIGLSLFLLLLSLSPPASVFACVCTVIFSPRSV